MDRIDLILICDRPILTQNFAFRDMLWYFGRCNFGYYHPYNKNVHRIRNDRCNVHRDIFVRFLRPLPKCYVIEIFTCVIPQRMELTFLFCAIASIIIGLRIGGSPVDALLHTFSGHVTIYH